MFSSFRTSRAKAGIEEFLNQYCANFRDYDTAANAIYHRKKLSEYLDICFATANFLFQTIKSQEGGSWLELKNDGDTENWCQLKRNLSQHTVIKLAYESTYQCHQLIFIPVGSQTYVVQSVGRMIDANWKLMDNDVLLASIRELFNGNTKELFGYDAGGSVNDLAFIAVARKSINLALLPDLAPYRKQLDQLRREFEQEESSCGPQSFRTP